MVRLGVPKTYKLFVGGGFPRSESGRSLAVVSSAGRVLAHAARASRKDLRDAVEVACQAQPAWAQASAYHRGQVAYRLAEMLESRRAEFVALLQAAGRAVPVEQMMPGERRSGRAGGARRQRVVPTRQADTGRHTGRRRARLAPAQEVALAVDRLVCFAGWADKYAQVLGCQNPVAGPYYNFTVPEPTGVVGIVAPDEPPLLGLISLLAPPLVAGNTVVALASEAHPLPGIVFGEVCATADVPAGVVNILTGVRDELLPHMASHRGLDAIHAAGLAPEYARLLRSGTAENLKRVTVREGVDFRDEHACHSPWWIEPFVEFKTIWHPSGT